MVQISTTEFKPGVKLEIDGQPYQIVINEFVKPGKGQPFNRVKMKNIVNGRVIERTYKSGEKETLADVQESEMRMLYQESDGVIFMDDTTFEQIKIPLDQIGDNIQWLVEDQVYEVVFYNGSPISIDPPTFMELKITQTDPGKRGDTASGRVLKPATLQTGAKIQVPIFVDEGETIKVDTRTGEYVSRVGT